MLGSAITANLSPLPFKDTECPKELPDVGVVLVSKLFLKYDEEINPEPVTESPDGLSVNVIKPPFSCLCGCLLGVVPDAISAYGNPTTSKSPLLFISKLNVCLVNRGVTILLPYLFAAG